MGKRGTLFADAALVYPPVLFAVLFVLYLLLFLFSVSFLRCEMHMCLRETVGTACGCLYRGEAEDLTALKQRSENEEALWEAAMEHSPILLSPRLETAGRLKLLEETREWTLYFQGKTPFFLDELGEKTMVSEKRMGSPAETARAARLLEDYGRVVTESGE